MTTYAPGSPIVLTEDDRLLRLQGDGAYVPVAAPLTEAKHDGPGPHAGTGSPQAVHSSVDSPRMEPVDFLARAVPNPGYDFHDVMASPERGRRLRDAYEDLPEVDDHPDVRAAHDAFMAETQQQFEMLTRSMGVDVQFTEEDPYESAEEMIADVRDNRRLHVFRARGDADTGRHPYVPNEAISRFRAVHDAFGHAATGRGFDRHGEEAAWAAHSQMYSPLARRAMTTATRGQNSAMVWGSGEFPVQKMALLDDWAMEEPPDLRETKHLGPGPHPSGTPQSVHAGGSRSFSRLVDGLRARADAGGRDGRIAHALLESVSGGIPDHQRSAGTLSLEWLGDLAPAVPGDDPEVTARRAAAYLRSLPSYEESDDAHEQGILIGHDGSIIGGSVLVGRARSIPMDVAVRDKGVAISLHNHPRENPLSPGDIRVVAEIEANRGEAISRAGRYSFGIDWGVVEDRTALREDVARIVSEGSALAKRRRGEGILSDAQVRYGTGDAIARALAESRPDVFTYEAEGPWDPMERWEDRHVSTLKRWVQ